MNELDRYAVSLENLEVLWVQIADQAREIEKLEAGIPRLQEQLYQQRTELAALKAKPSAVVRWPEADEIMQMAFEEGQPSEDASGYYFELEEFDLFIQRLMEEVARLNSSPVSARCKGKDCGATDGVSHSAACIAEHEATVCAGGADEQVRHMVPDGWNVERGCSPSGYVLHSPGGSMIRVCDSGMGGIETAFAMFLKALLAATPSAGSQKEQGE